MPGPQKLEKLRLYLDNDVIRIVRPFEHFSQIVVPELLLQRRIL